mgnify:FL=1
MSFRKVQISNIQTDATHFNDPLITLNYDETGTNTSDIGLILERGSLSNVALIWDESEDQFGAITTTHDGSTDGNVGISAYADFKASTFIGNLTGNVTGNVTGDVTGDVTGTVSSLSNHDTDSLSEGSTNQYYTNARARASISATGSLSYNSSTGVISYTAPTNVSDLTNDSGFITTTITDTSTGSSAGPVINLFRNNASPSNANYLGQIKFQGKSSTGTTRTYAKITGKIADVSNSSEDGTIEFSVLNSGSAAIPVRINENGLYLNAGYTLKFEGPVANTNELTVTSASLSTDRTITFPDATGTVALTNSFTRFHSSTQTVTSSEETTNVSSTVDYTFSDLSGAVHYNVFLNRVLLRPDEFSVSGSTLTIAVGVLAQDDELEVSGFGT